MFQFISFGVIWKRIKAIKFMLMDKKVSFLKKMLIIGGIIYLLSPLDLIPPVLFPIGFIDDLVLWIWILWHLKDELDKYWLGEKTEDLSGKYKDKDVYENTEYEVRVEE